MTVGAAVLWDLWQIMDIKRGNSMVCGSFAIHPDIN